MPMGIELAAIVALLRSSAELIKASKELHAKGEEPIIDKLATHIRSIEAWSGQVQFLGMSTSVPTDKTTIPIKINSHPRTFISSSDKNKSLTEADIISSERNFLILGDPGSGKTTIVKRLLRAILLKEPRSKADACNFPMLIIAREVKPGNSIVQSIADELGLQYEVKEPTEVSSDSSGPSLYEKTPSEPGYYYSKGTYYYQGRRLENVIVDFLNESRALLFVDGIDELGEVMRSMIEPELERLARGNGVKIIVTCRSGEYGRRQIEGYNVVEVAPLKVAEIRRISKKWATKPTEFLSALDKAPYRDAADRPLFLTQLIQVYNAFSRLPTRPADVYQKIITLSLDTWDRGRRVFRKSQYAEFDSERKLDFLAALSFELTYKIRTKRFSHKELETAYQAICGRFGLPPNKAEEVCTEVEGHSGLILKSYDFFEFSHLSLQEYLCAYHMVRLPFEPIMVEYLDQYPAPVAVAVSISAEPSSWLAALIYHAKQFDSSEKSDVRYGSIPEQSAFSLISRLSVEGPIFSTSAAFGMAILKLLSSFQTLDEIFRHEGNDRDRKLIAERDDRFVMGALKAFVNMDGIIESIKQAFDCYYFDSADNVLGARKTFMMRRGTGGRGRYSERLLNEIDVRVSVLDFLQAEFGLELQWLTAEGAVIRGNLPF
jgi:hypothetical protein